MNQIPNTPFNGIFDLAIRKQLREKRRSVGVSLEQLGDFLKIHWSTVRKWEAGVTTMCHPRHISPIDSFLKGEYDNAIRIRYGIAIVIPQPNVPQPSLIPARRGTGLPPGLENTLIMELERIFVATLKNFLDQFR